MLHLFWELCWLFLVPVVGFNAGMTSEHFASFLVFIIIHVMALVYYIKGILSPKLFKVAVTLVISVGLVVCLAALAVLIALVASSPMMGWSGRSLSLLDPTYARVMVRLMLVFAPAACTMSGIALSGAFDALTCSIKFQMPGSSETEASDAADTSSENNVTENNGPKANKTETLRERPSKKGKKREKEKEKEISETSSSRSQPRKKKKKFFFAAY